MNAWDCGIEWDFPNMILDILTIELSHTSYHLHSWWFQTFLFFHYGIILPIDFHIFQRGRSTTNQISFSSSFHPTAGISRLSPPWCNPQAPPAAAPSARGTSGACPSPHRWSSTAPRAGATSTTNSCGSCWRRQAGHETFWVIYPLVNIQKAIEHGHW